jgi:hypothetical protein
MLQTKMEIADPSVSSSIKDSNCDSLVSGTEFAYTNYQGATMAVSK